MKVTLMIGAVLAACSAGSHAVAAQSMQPPMDGFNNQFYTCDNEGAFLMSYDSKKPAKATMTTSHQSKRYELKKAPAATGVQFSEGQVRFWTDGHEVVVEGTEIPLLNCKRKSA